ncbi:MAG: hypothetical protein ACYYKD_06590 [Rhodospirillales bacterium]
MSAWRFWRSYFRSHVRQFDEGVVMNNADDFKDVFGISSPGDNHQAKGGENHG